METDEKLTENWKLEENRPVFFGPCAPLAGAGPKGPASTKDPCRTKTGLPKGSLPLNFYKTHSSCSSWIFRKASLALKLPPFLSEINWILFKFEGKSCRIGAVAAHGRARPCCRGQLEATLTAAAAEAGLPGFCQSTDLDQIQPLSLHFLKASQFFCPLRKLQVYAAAEGSIESVR